MSSLRSALNVWFGSVVDMRCTTFHADLHAGNLLVMGDGRCACATCCGLYLIHQNSKDRATSSAQSICRVGFIDFGIVGTLAPSSWQAIQASSSLLLLVIILCSFVPAILSQLLQLDAHRCATQRCRPVQALAASAAVSDFDTIARALATVGATGDNIDVQVPCLAVYAAICCRAVVSGCQSAPLPFLTSLLTALVAGLWPGPAAAV